MKARRTIALFFISLFYALSALAADSITGKVTNLTTRKPAADMEVVLLRSEKGMEEEARARTDAQGGFVLPLPAVAGSQHMLRVVHQGVNYDQALSGKGPVEIAVFDTVRKIPNLQANIGMAQLESDGAMLKVTEMYAITNKSSPPVTQLRPRNFEVSLAENAVLDSFTIKRGGGWVVVTPVPVEGQSGRYAVDYPLQPGETLFKFIYHLPYTGPTTIHVKPAYPVANFAVMHPPSMKFKASNPRAFTSPGVTHGLQVEQAVRKPVVREAPSFEISGIGLAPPANNAAEASPAVRLTPTPATGSPAAASQPVNQGRQEVGAWAAVLSGLAALLAASVFMVWRKRKRTAS
jgi:hypothetical protein